MKGTRFRKITPYLYLLPALVLAVAFAYRPFIATIVASLYHVRPNGSLIRFVGLDNFRALFASDSFHDSLANTLRFALAFVPANLAATFGLALLCRYKGKSAPVLRNLLLLTMAVAMSSMMLIFKTLFDENTGLIDRIIARPVRWFSDPHAARAMLVYSSLSLDFGFDFLLFTASLLNIPRDLEEVADLAGADGWRRFRYLDFPMVAPTFVFVLANNLKDALLICSPVLILTEGGPLRATQTLVYQMYLEGFKGGSLATASALCVVVFAISFGLFAVIMAVQKRRVFYQ